MTFKDLQYSFGKFSSDVKSRMAKSNPMHKRDTKALEVWISEERHDLAAMKTLAYHKQNTIKSFRTWAQAHEPWNESDERTDIQVQTTKAIQFGRSFLHF
ncbi:hypothetical protein BC940DRAFT_121039 [Gongronella butleri]|nr:hypothetical protein BC940DRAFT_121039 [Gongronella butleri]